MALPHIQGSSSSDSSPQPPSANDLLPSRVESSAQAALLPLSSIDDRMRKAAEIAATLPPPQTAFFASTRLIHKRWQDNNDRQPPRTELPTQPHSIEEIGKAKDLMIALRRKNPHFLGQGSITMALHLLLQGVERICGQPAPKIVKTRLKMVAGHLLDRLFMPIENHLDKLSEMARFRHSLLSFHSNICVELTQLGLLCSSGNWQQGVEDIQSLFEACYVLFFSAPEFLRPFPEMSQKLSKEQKGTQLADQFSDIVYILKEFLNLYPHIVENDPDRIFRRGLRETRDEIERYEAIGQQLRGPLKNPGQLYGLILSVFERAYQMNSTLPVSHRCAQWILNEEKAGRFESGDQTIRTARRVVDCLVDKVEVLLRSTLEFILSFGSHPIQLSSPFTDLMSQLVQVIEEYIKYSTGEERQLIDTLPDPAEDDHTPLSEAIRELKATKQDEEGWQDTLELFHRAITTFESAEPSASAHQVVVDVTERLHYHLGASSAEFYNWMDLRAVLGDLSDDLRNDTHYLTCLEIIERSISFDAFRLESGRALTRLLHQAMAEVFLPSTNSAAESSNPSSDSPSPHSAIGSQKLASSKKKTKKKTLSSPVVSQLIPEAASAETAQPPPQRVNEDFTVCLVAAAGPQSAVDGLVSSLEICRQLVKKYPVAKLHLEHASCCLAQMIVHSRSPLSIETPYDLLEPLRRAMEFTLHAARRIYTPDDDNIWTHVLELIAYPLFRVPIPSDLAQALEGGWLLIQTLSEGNAALHYPHSTPTFYHPELKNFLLTVQQELDESSSRKLRRLLDAGTTCLENILRSLLSPSSDQKKVVTPRLMAAPPIEPPSLNTMAVPEMVEVFDRPVLGRFQVNENLTWIQRWMTLLKIQPCKVNDSNGEWRKLRDIWIIQSLPHLRRLKRLIESQEPPTPFTALELLDSMRRLAKGVISFSLAQSGSPFDPFENNPRTLACLLPVTIGLPPCSMSWAHWASHYPLDTGQAARLGGKLKPVMEEFQSLLPTVYQILETPDRPPDQRTYQVKVQNLVKQVVEEVCKPTLNYLHRLCQMVSSN